MRYIKVTLMVICLAVMITSSITAAPIAGGSLDPLTVPKFVNPLVIPPVMPVTDKINARGGKNIDYYEIAVRQFQQQILPATDVDGKPLNPTTVWGYGSVNHPGTFNYPAFTIESRWKTPVRVKWINDLKDNSGNYLPHLFAVDQTLHWANPPGGINGRDSRPTFTETPPPYDGPVPFVTHVHGAHTTDDSDGYPEAWYLPAAKNISAEYATVGTWYSPFKAKSEAANGQTWDPGSSVFQYPNDQRATTLWYHDHTLGMTRLNVYAGPAGFYLIRGGPDDQVNGTLPGPAPKPNDKPGKRYYEIPLAIQDRSFNADGSLFYPDSRSFFDGVTGPFMPETDISPNWNPEFFGNMMLVNGKTWPVLQVEPRRYRFRLLNGCNSRFLVLDLSNPALSFWQIGAEGGFLPAPAKQDQILMAPAERADVIIDFTGLAAGTEVVLQNIGPDEPFGGGTPGIDFPVADPDTTGQVMKFVVGRLISPDRSTPPAKLKLPAIKPLGLSVVRRQVTLNEMMSMDFDDAPAAAILGVLENGMTMHKMWDDPITENPMVGAAEVWEIFNFTADAHPIHLHQVQFQVVDRQELLTDIDDTDDIVQPVQVVGQPWLPEAGETGFKDTVIAYPGQVTRLKARFDIPGLFVWHCHIVEHEDNEMMRPLFVGPNSP
ncbi:MAG: multicopper oxidase family protein [Armatimonadota bacterium]